MLDFLLNISSTSIGFVFECSTQFNGYIWHCTLKSHIPILGADDCLQQHQLVGGIPKPAQSSLAAVHDIKGSRKDGSNGAGPVRNVKGRGAVGAPLWKLDLGGDRVDTQVPEGIPLSSGATDHGDDGETWGRRRVGVSSGRRINVLR